MLMADEMRFVSPGFPLSDLTGYLWGKRLPFRTFRYVDKETATRLLYLLNDTSNASDEYISEISRVERLVMERDKMLYRKRSEGFGWDEAANVMELRKE
jgi:hypothetical protein